MGACNRQKNNLKIIKERACIPSDVAVIYGGNKSKRGNAPKENKMKKYTNKTIKNDTVEAYTFDEFWAMAKKLPEAEIKNGLPINFNFHGYQVRRTGNGKYAFTTRQGDAGSRIGIWVSAEATRESIIAYGPTTGVRVWNQYLFAGVYAPAADTAPTTAAPVQDYTEDFHDAEEN